ALEILRRYAAFPDCNHPPARAPQFACLPHVALDICGELRLPEGPIALRRVAVPAARMAVPEAPMHKDCSSVTGQHYVWPSGEFPVVQAKTKTCSVQKRSDNNFRLCISALDTRHHLAAFSLAD